MADELSDLLKELSDEPEEACPVKQAPKTSQLPTVEPEAEAAAISVEEELQRFDQLQALFLENHAFDRANIQKITGHYILKIEGGEEGLSGTHMEAAVKAMEVQANMNLALSKLMDARSRLVVALKATQKGSQGDGPVGITIQSVQNILNAPDSGEP